MAKIKRNYMSDALPLWLFVNYNVLTKNKMACQPSKLKFPKTLIAFC